MLVASAIEWRAHTGTSPAESSYGALVHAFAAFQVFYAAAAIAMALYAVARRYAGLLDDARRSAFDSLSLFWHYCTAQGIVGLALVHGFPRMAG
jgi:cytochrome c oxidase subunit I+III